MLATGLGAGSAEVRVSTRNRHDGVVRAIHPGAVNAEVIVDAGGLAIVAIVDQHALADLGLQPGSAVSALVKPSDVILATVA